MKKQEEVIKMLGTLEEIWDEYEVYSRDELNPVKENLNLEMKEKGKIDE